MPGRKTPAPEPPSGTATPRRRWPGSRWIWVVVVVCALELWALSTVPSGSARVTIPYAPTFVAPVQASNVTSVTFTRDKIAGTFRRGAVYPPGEDSAPQKEFATRQPPPPGDATLLPLLRAKGVTVTAEGEENGSALVAIVLVVAPWLIIIAFFVWASRGAARGATSVFGTGRSHARRYQPVERVTFDDVAGIDEAKAELTQVVDFLEQPERFRKLGARIPRGALLTGPPGTGKTLLARAVAGEAEMPFFSMSASEFIEMLVGVGASRVRDLFDQAKAAALTIVFIDELDAIGRSRAAAIHLGGGSDEREQTLNQILTEMDGFDPSTGVIVLAAMNRPDVLDSALLRAGRFDRRIAVQPPDKAGRLAILRVPRARSRLAPTPTSTGSPPRPRARWAPISRASRRSREPRERGRPACRDARQGRSGDGGSRRRTREDAPRERTETRDEPA